MSRKAINSLQEESLKFGSFHSPVVYKNVQIRSWPVIEVVFMRMRIGYSPPDIECFSLIAADSDCGVIGISFGAAPPSNMFFEQTELQGLFHHHSLQATGFTTRVFDPVSVCSARRVAGQPTLTSFHEVLRPFVVNAV